MTSVSSTRVGLLKGNGRAHDKRPSIPGCVSKLVADQFNVGHPASRTPAPGSFPRCKVPPSEGGLGKFPVSHYREDGLRPNIGGLFSYYKMFGGER